MTKHVNPLMECLQKRFGEHPDFEVAALLVKRKTGRKVVGGSLRLIAQGHRAPSGYLALDIETAFDGEVTARDLLEWEHYSRTVKRAA